MPRFLLPRGARHAGQRSCWPGSLAWDHDALTALKLICNLRGVRGTGKSEKEGFYTAALRLHENHPKTLACNMKAIAEFGYFKDMLEILYRLLEGAEIRKSEKADWDDKWDEKKDEIKGAKHGFKPKFKVDKETVRSIRLQKTASKAKKAFETYNRDPDYRFLHDCVSDVFAELLRADMQFYNPGELYKIGLASKWCPTLDSSYEKSTLMCEGVARKVFPREEFPEYQDVEEAHYAYRIEKRSTSSAPQGARVAEVYICTNKWDQLPYKRVASVAMKTYKKLFYKHDKERFQEYLEKVKSGKSTIAAGALLPHQIISSLEDGTGPEVAELKWKRMVEDLAKKGKLRNCMGICDVSGSMMGTPMEVSVALGLALERQAYITFSNYPQFHEIRGDSLLSKTSFIREMDWNLNTDFQRVFDRILEVAVRGSLGEEQMIKTLFVFSDMEFDQASTSRSWETDYQVIQRKFGEKGFRKVPQIVFWKLRNSKATPVPSNQEGVALLSGFSKNLVTLFLEGDGILSPDAVMQQAISGEEYQKLVVID
ncbi:hypothetical protein RJ639_002315 [Escallonia herrerae]|uniref:DUF2828 domain-containing protein n=1 Tax=Escallonia herrerae TaxID=1293975 RepID=A0AA88X856_9ASTE|nr:hypothetical protein RJ639_002315 [Escallonia herrerae]